MQSSSIRVGARLYTVVLLNDARFDASLNAKWIDSPSTAASYIDYDAQEIVIRSKMKPDHIRELLLHELMHAMLEDTGANCQVECEKFVSVLAPRMNQLMSDGLPSLLDDVASNL